jgi:polar amino acid transport system substrate-binding protein
LCSHLISLSLAMLLLHTPARGKTYHCVSFEYPPLVTQAHGAGPTGFAVELIDLIFKKLDADMTVTLYPWERAMAIMRQGLADCIFTIYRVPERELFIDYSKELVATQMIYLYARKGSGATFHGDLSLIRVLRVGVVRQISYGPRFEQARSTLQIV